MSLAERALLICAAISIILGDVDENSVISIALGIVLSVGGLYCLFNLLFEEHRK